MRFSPPGGHLQAIWRRLSVRLLGRTGAVDVLLVTYPDRVMTPEHEHEWDSLHWVLSGSVRETYAGAERIGRPGDVLAYRAGTSHATHVAPGTRLLHVPVSERALPRGHDHDAGVPVLRPRLLRLLASMPASISLHEVRALLEAMEHEPGSPDVDPLARTARRALERQPVEATLGTLAPRCGIGARSLARRFRAAYGCSVGEMRHELQVAEVARRLLAGSAPLTEIALATGFSDQSHMGRIFRRHLGSTPLAFRRLAGPRA